MRRPWAVGVEVPGEGRDGRVAGVVPLEWWGRLDMGRPPGCRRWIAAVPVDGCVWFCIDMAVRQMWLVVIFVGVTLTNDLSKEKHVTNLCRSTYVEIRRLITSVTISLLMLQKPSSVPLFCQNLTTVILFYQVLQNIFLTNSKRSKIRQPGLSSKLASTNTSNPSFRNFTGYQ